MIPARGNIHSSRLAKRRRRFFFLKIFLTMLLFGGFVSGVAYVLRDERVNIARVYVEGNSAVPTEEILSLVRQKIEGSYFYLFPKRNILLYPRRGIEASVASAYPRLNAVKVSLRDLSSIVLKVEEKLPFALWCGAEYVLEDRGLCYFTDERGFIFAKAPDFSGSSFKRYFTPLSGSEPIGQNLLPVEVFQTLQSFLATLDGEELAVSGVSLHSAGSAQAHLQGGGRILFNLNQDLPLALENLKLLFRSNSFAGQSKQVLASLDYIDLESPNKIFYKPKGSISVKPTNNGTSTLSQ